MCVATGQAAVNYALLNLAGMGSNLVSPPQLYGTTHTLFARILPGQGVTVRFAESDRAEAIERLIDAETLRHLLRERRQSGRQHLRYRGLRRRRTGTASHSWWITPWPRRCCCARSSTAPISWCTRSPSLWAGMGQRSGASSSTAATFPGRSTPARFPMFSEPDHSYHGLVYTERFGPAAYIARCRSRYWCATGAVLAPLSAFLLLQGVETAALRVERHVENGRKVAEFLRSDPRVTWVKYAGFPESSYYALGKKYLNGHGCSLMTLGVKGGYEAAIRFYDTLKLVSRLVNLGDAKSLACHPASTTHRQMSPEEQHKAGVLPEMIRLSIGIEHIDDIVADLDQALNAAM